MKSNYRHYILPIAITAVFCWSAFGIVVTKMVPPLDGATGIGLFLFYLSLVFSLLSSFIVLLCFCRRWILKERDLKKAEFTAAIRQAAFLSALAVLSLALKRWDVLNWWSGILLVSAIVLAEYYLSQGQGESR